MTIEVIGTAEGKVTLIGLEVSGPRLHLGHHMILRDLERCGGRKIIYLSEIHAQLNNKAYQEKNLISLIRQIKLIYPSLEVITSKELLSRDYFLKVLKLSKYLKFRDFARSLPDDIMEKKNTLTGETSMTSNYLLYVIMQVCDSNQLGADQIYAGMDQRKIYMRLREVYPKIGWSVPKMYFYPLLTYEGKKLSKSTQAQILRRQAVDVTLGGPLYRLCHTDHSFWAKFYDENKDRLPFLNCEEMKSTLGRELEKLAHE